MNPMNNPMLRDLILLRQQGLDPDTAAQHMTQRYPQFQMVCRKTPEQLQTMLTNMYKECGMTIEDAARSLGIQIRSNR